MSVQPVKLYPDDTLKRVCDASDRYQGDVEEVARDLLDTMRAHPGCVGIAAPQIGALVRMIAVDVTGHKRAQSCHGPMLLIDPVIVEASDERVMMREGCLSIPHLTANVRRSADVLLEASALDGHTRVAADAYEARVLLHELDHLDGLLFLDRVDSAADVFPRKRYRS